MMTKEGLTKFQRGVRAFVLMVMKKKMKEVYARMNELEERLDELELKSWGEK